MEGAVRRPGGRGREVRSGFMRMKQGPAELAGMSDRRRGYLDEFRGRSVSLRVVV